MSTIHRSLPPVAYDGTDTVVPAPSIDGLGGDYDPALYHAHGNVVVLDGGLTDVPRSTWHSSYRTEGFVAVSALLDRDEVGAARDGIDHLITDGVAGFRGIQWEAGSRARLPEAGLAERRDMVRKLMYYVEHDVRLHAAAHQPALLAAAAEILGDEPELFADQALLKPPGGGREKPWHQDKAYFDLVPGSPVVGVWIALDDTDVDNGCMHLIPGSHRSGPVVHFNRRDFQICDTDVVRDRVMAVPLPAGGALLFDGLLHHGTPANLSTRRRWALQFHYAPRSAIWQSSEERRRYKEERLAVFGADGKDATC